METRRRSRIKLKRASTNGPFSDRRSEQHRQQHQKLELSDDVETSDSVFISGSETLAMSSSRTPLDKTAPVTPFPAARNDGSIVSQPESGIVGENDLSESSPSKNDMPPSSINIPPSSINIPVSQSNPHHADVRQLSIGSSLERRQLSIESSLQQTINDEATTSDTHDNLKPHLSETTGWSNDLHMTHPVGMVRSSNRDLPPLPNSNQQEQGENAQNKQKLPAASLQFGWNPIHPETTILNRKELHDQSISTSNTLGRDCLLSSGSLPTSMMKLSPLLSSSIRLGGCLGLMDGSLKKISIPEDQLESCFSDRHVQVFVVTWNMQEIKVSE